MVTVTSPYTGWGECLKERLKGYSLQGLSQDLETGCLKFEIVKFVGVQIFKGDHYIVYTQISTLDLYKFVKKRHDILMQYHGNSVEMCPEGYFLRVWVSKKTPRRPAG